MKQEELYKILYYHKLWVESKGEKGKQANLISANLYNANLISANLISANLYNANLYGAYLVGANLEQTNLKCAYVSRVNLKGAKFTTEIREARIIQGCEITKDQLPWLALHPEFSKFYHTLRVS